MGIKEKEQDLLWKRKREIQEKICELMQAHSMGDAPEDDAALLTLSKAVGLIDICKSIPELAWILESYKITKPKHQHWYMRATGEEKK